MGPPGLGGCGLANHQASWPGHGSRPSLPFSWACLTCSLSTALCFLCNPSSKSPPPSLFPHAPDHTNHTSPPTHTHTAPLFLLVYVFLLLEGEMSKNCNSACLRWCVSRAQDNAWNTVYIQLIFATTETVYDPINI